MRDLRAERLLEREGVAFSFVENYPLSKVRLDGRAKEQIRIAGTDAEVAEEYGEAMKQQGGTKSFPAIVVATGGAQISGIHRKTGAEQAGFGGFDTYLVDTDDPNVIRRLRLLFNKIEGRREHRDEMVQHAYGFVRDGYSIKDAAELCGVPEGTVGNFVRRQQTKDELQQFGVPTKTINAAPDYVIDTVRLAPTTVTRAKVLDIVARFHLGREDARAMVKAVKDAPGDKQALAALDDYEARAKAATGNGRRPAQRPASAGVEAAITRIERAVKRIDRERLSPSASVAVAKRLRECGEFLLRAADDL